MTVIVKELRDALVEAGASPEKADAAAAAVVHRDDLAQLATRTDISDVRTALAETKVEIIKWVVGIAMAQAGLIIALIKLLPG